MTLYRLTASRYARDLSGEGARLYGGRWNHAGTPCLYTAENRSLAILEYSVNTGLDHIPRALSLIALEVPDSSIKLCAPAELPGNRRDVPAPNSTKDFGTYLLQAKEFLVLRIPSNVVPQEYNCLINPMHRLAGAIQVVYVTDFVYDLRIKQG